MIGQALGNKRLVQYEQNRSDGARFIREKMPFLEGGHDANRLGSSGDFLIREGSFVNWLKADPGDKIRNY